MPKTIETRRKSNPSVAGRRFTEAAADFLLPARVQNVGAEKPRELVQDVAAGLYDYYNPPKGQNALEDIGLFAGHIVKKGAEQAAFPITATRDLLQWFGEEMVGGAIQAFRGATGQAPTSGIQDSPIYKRFQQYQSKYGPLVGSTLGLGEAEAKLMGAFAAGAGLGAVKNAIGDQAPGLYVLEVQRMRVKDPKISLEELADDHRFYHEQLGNSSEQPHMSIYHDQLADRFAKELGYRPPVLQEDYEEVFSAVGREYPEYAVMNLNPAYKGPRRQAPGAPPVDERTIAEDTAIYRYEYSRTYTRPDQWKDFQSGVLSDLRRLDASDETLAQIKDLSPGQATAEDFASRILDNVDDLPRGSRELLQAWQDEIVIARDLYKDLRQGQPMARAESSPVSAFEDELFHSSRPARANAQAARALREASELYGMKGDEARASAYSRAADILTQKGAPNIENLADEGVLAIREAFQGQGGIGKNIASHLRDFVQKGSWKELVALRKLFNK